MRNDGNLQERIARLEEKMIAADKALGLAQESIFQRAALESRVSVLEAAINRNAGEKKGSNDMVAWIISGISILIAMGSFILRR